MSLSLALLLFIGSPATREVYLMGTRSVLTAYGSTVEAADAQLEKYVRILEDTESELSVWRAETALSRLNATPVGRQFHAGRRLFTLLQEVVLWWKETAGAFDPGIGRLLDARGSYGRSAARHAILPTIGMRHIVLDEKRQSVVREADVWIDSGAFGKGEALDRVRAQAQRDGDGPWLIDLGGQVMVYGARPLSSSWPVDIAHPRQRDRVALTLEVGSGSVSTTGTSEQPGHVLNPHTRLPIDFNGSVVVWHESGFVADILSTALFVMGPEKGLQWAAERRMAACFLVPEGDRLRIRPTRQFADQFGIEAGIR